MLPYVPIADRVRIGVAMFSYRGTLTFGLTGDLDDRQGVHVLAAGVQEAMAELLTAARLRTATVPAVSQVTTEQG